MGDPPDCVGLYRRAWHPDHLDAGGVTGTQAFRKEDLQGGDDFVSVDRSDRFDREVALASVREEQAKAWAKADENSKPRTMKAKAVYIVLPCGGVRQAKDTEGVQPFTVTEAWQADNPAHCAIRNVSGKRSPSYVNQLRKLLLGLVESEHILLDEAAPGSPDGAVPSA